MREGVKGERGRGYERVAARYLFEEGGERGGGGMREGVRVVNRVYQSGCSKVGAT